MQCFDQSAERVLVQREALGNGRQKIQVFESRLGLFSFLFGGSSLVRRAFQIKLQVHAYRTRQNVVHHNDSDVLASALDAVQAKELRQQSSGVLIQVLEKKK